MLTYVLEAVSHFREWWIVILLFILKEIRKHICVVHKEFFPSHVRRATHQQILVTQDHRKRQFCQTLRTGKEVIIQFHLIFFCLFPFSYDDCYNRYIILISVFALLDSYYFRSPKYFPVELSIFLSWTWPDLVHVPFTFMSVLLLRHYFENYLSFSFFSLPFSISFPAKNVNNLGPSKSCLYKHGNSMTCFYFDLHLNFLL